MLSRHRPTPPQGAPMPTIEVNKIIASVLTALIVMMVGMLLADEIIRPKKLEKPVFVAAGTAPANAPTAQPAAAQLAPIGPLLAKADAAKGQGLTKICQVCHSFDKGGPNKVGPNLWDVVGQPIGEDRGGYPFSDALEKHKGQKWDPETLNKWLDNPQSFAQGTKMSFVGFPEAQNRADVIKYLESLK
jgi:cytochrome c